VTVAEVERIGAPQIDPGDAHRAYKDYRRALKTERNAVVRAELAVLARSYRAIARGASLLDLHKVMGAAGLQPDTGFPRLAIGRADWKFAHVWLQSNGAATFTPDSSRWNSRRQASQVDLPPDTFGVDEIRAKFRGLSGRAEALTPMIPPAGRPAHDLSNYFILWDAVWKKEPPMDPLLLKHLGGPLYAILFAWDLTPLEQAVMRGRL
jgi:hypothetical protein